MLKIMIDDDLFPKECSESAYSKAQVLYDLLNDQLISAAASGEKEGDLIENGRRVGHWKQYPKKKI